MFAVLPMPVPMLRRFTIETPLFSLDLASVGHSSESYLESIFLL